MAEEERAREKKEIERERGRDTERERESERAWRSAWCCPGSSRWYSLLETESLIGPRGGRSMIRRTITMTLERASERQRERERGREQEREGENEREIERWREGGRGAREKEERQREREREQSYVCVFTFYRNSELQAPKMQCPRPQYVTLLVEGSSLDSGVFLLVLR